MDAVSSLSGDQAKRLLRLAAVSCSFFFFLRVYTLFLPSFHHTSNPEFTYAGSSAAAGIVLPCGHNSCECWVVFGGLDFNFDFAYNLFFRVVFSDYHKEVVQVDFLFVSCYTLALESAGWCVRNLGHTVSMTKSKNRFRFQSKLTAVLKSMGGFFRGKIILLISHD